MNLTESMSAIIGDVEAHLPLLLMLGKELKIVEEVFENQLDSDLPAVRQLCTYVEKYRGKMLRPTLTILAGLAADPSALIYSKKSADTPQTSPLKHAHRVLAAVCEMVHMATLVHDDVLDDADMRRKGATVNYLQGNEAAVLLGDYLISNAFHLCSTLHQPELNERIGEVTNSMCAGELLQLHNRENWSIDEATYFTIINRKTASLIAVCCELGAQISTDDKNIITQLGNFGHYVGLAFQIQDDLLDLVGKEDIVGKSLGKDLEKRKLTLPMILHFQQADPKGREKLLHLLTNSNPNPNSADHIRVLIETSGAVEAAQQKATDLVNQARKCLHSLPDSSAKLILDELANALLKRRF